MRARTQVVSEAGRAITAEGFAEHYAKNFAPLVKVARRLLRSCGQEDWAEDCVQHAYMKAGQHLDRYESDGHFRATLFLTLKQRTGDLRRRWFYREGALRDFWSQGTVLHYHAERMEPPVDNTQLTSRRRVDAHVMWAADHADETLRGDVAAAVDALPARQREIARRYYLDGNPREGREVERVARELGISEKTVRRELTRVREALAGMLEEYAVVPSSHVHKGRNDGTVKSDADLAREMRERVKRRRFGD